MGTRIAPFTALRAFEAAVRLNSFTKAADDLMVTPAAISQQIKLLEDFVKVPLFERRNKGIRVTEAGRECYPLVADAFELLRKASQRMNAFRPPNRLVVSLWPSLASHWLAPDLFRWASAQADTQISVSASVEEPDFDDGDVDVRICYGRPHQRRVMFEELLTGQLVAVCSPGLIADDATFRSPNDILRYPLLHVHWGPGELALPTWYDWFTAAGAEVSPEQSCAGAAFNLFNLAIQAAVEGQGFVLAQTALVEKEIALGHLVRCFDTSLCMSHPYFLVYPEKTLAKPGAQALLQWLRQLASHVADPGWV